ncbi:coproporphyrinogen III oxidase [Photobacterium aquae]|uniref:Coproporphyrinogen III oxidase n=1 Tax=Photobacterium aquae TaxID=1195763 RepID=A0A0J1H7V2_9GAMM|nr:DUF2489 domain-containing protein [Photobacterium aquae]KLV07794.1 coproporphyrinogen III oxidase [Photobacterium aquae]
MTLWLGLAALIVVPLAAYAVYLLVKLYQQHRRHVAFMAQAQQRQAEGIRQRNANIMESVYTIAEAALQGQCDLSEAAIRLCKLMEVLQGESQIDAASCYPALHELYLVVQDMPRGEARSTLAKQERMKLDLIRMKAEARLNETIKADLARILETKPQVA